MIRDAFVSHIKGGGHSHMTAQPLLSDCSCPNPKVVTGCTPGSLVARGAWGLCNALSKILTGMLVDWHLALIPHLVLKPHLAVGVHTWDRLAPLHQKHNMQELDFLLEKCLRSQVNHGLVPCFFVSWRLNSQISISLPHIEKLAGFHISVYW